MCFAFAALALIAGTAQAQTMPSLDGFGDAIHHWRNVHGSDYATYRPDQVREIADNVLLYQRANGGWIENRDPTRILTDAEGGAIAAERDDPKASFDNRNIWSQTGYLLDAYALLHDARYRDAALRGLDFMLAQQIASCGGWPHTLPPTSSYHDKITIADDVTSGALRFLRRVGEGRGAYGAIDLGRRARAVEALERGEACVLRLQVRQNGVPTGWAGQYDPVTLAPVQGRAFELPSIVSQETVQMLRYLMEIERPSPEIAASVEAGVAWLRRVAIRGMRYETVTLAGPVRFQYHIATTDRRLVPDPAAPLVWARFYDLADNSVVLANRDSKRVERLDQIHLERRSGYSWYGDWPAELIEVEYPRWKARLGH